MNNTPPITKNLLIINILMFFGMFVAKRYNIDLNQYLGLHFVLSEDFNTAQFITYMFMHGGFSHILFNMFAVWMFGQTLEQVWGPKRFLTYYLICGIGAGIIQEIVTGISYQNLVGQLSPDNLETIQREGATILQQAKNYTNPILGQFNVTLNGYTVGASGAVYGILLAFGMIFPNQPLYVFPFIFFPIKAKYFVIGYALIELYAGMNNTPGDHVAHFAHLGGMIFGFILIKYWQNKSRNNGYYHN